MTRPDRIKQLLDLSSDRMRSHDSAISCVLANALESVALPEDMPAPNSTAHLSSDLTSFPRSQDDLLDEVKRSFALLSWRTPGFGKLSAALCGHLSVVELVGPTGSIPHNTIRFGFLFQGAGVHYPRHSHAAEELYLILSGQADWEVDGRSVGVLGAGQFAHHLPWQTHAMQTFDQPMLTMWGWIGDIGSDQYRIFENA